MLLLIYLGERLIIISKRILYLDILLDLRLVVLIKSYISFKYLVFTFFLSYKF